MYTIHISMKISKINKTNNGKGKFRGAIEMNLP